MAIVTGRICLRFPEYSPISSGVKLVLRNSSAFHCLAETEFVTRISVVVCTWAMVAAPTTVLPAPHGRTTTPDSP